MHLKFQSKRSGCVYYTREVQSCKKPFLYCFQPERNGFGLYRCSLDGEPSHEIALDQIQSVELPGESRLEDDLLSFLKDKNINIQPIENR